MKRNFEITKLYNEIQTLTLVKALRYILNQNGHLVIYLKIIFGL